VSLGDGSVFNVYPTVLLGDFGLSAPLRVAQTIGIGTYGYTAPVSHSIYCSSAKRALTHVTQEVPRGPSRPDSEHFQWTTSCDIFSLGATVWNIMSLASPPDILTATSMLPSLPSHYSNDLRQLVMQCYSVDSNSRPTATDILSACL
jgi:serine/threonine protein kinase